MIRLPPSSTRTVTLFLYTALFLSFGGFPPANDGIGALPSLVAYRAGENGHIAHPGRDFGRDLLYSAQSRPGGVRQCGHHSHSRAIGRPFRAYSVDRKSVV